MCTHILLFLFALFLSRQIFSSSSFVRELFNSGAMQTFSVAISAYLHPFPCAHLKDFLAVECDSSEYAVQQRSLQTRTTLQYEKILISMFVYLLPLQVSCWLILFSRTRCSSD